MRKMILLKSNTAGGLAVEMGILSVGRKVARFMNSNVFKRVSAFLLAVFVAFGMLCVSVKDVKAESGLEVGISSVVWKGEKNGWFGLFDPNEKIADDQYIITAVKSSNPAVLKTKLEADPEGDYAWGSYTAKKTGKVVVTVDYKFKDGTTGSASANVTVKPYPNNIKSLKVNGKTVKISKNKFQCQRKFKGSKAKIKMALKKGWKIDSVDASGWNKSFDKQYKIKVTKKGLLKGKYFKVPAKCKYVDVNVTLRKGNNFFYYYIGLHR